MQVRRGLGEHPQQALGGGQRIAALRHRHLHRGPQLARPQVGDEGEQSRGAVDPHLGGEPPLLAEPVGERARRAAGSVPRRPRWTGIALRPSSPPIRRQTWRTSRSQLSMTSTARASPGQRVSASMPLRTCTHEGPMFWKPWQPELSCWR
ncbi:hypothetical protein [Streptomyces gougerotii]|uniref:hypothetical protein n=1 Tax=Streptomyces gougerotii TaxID=53448 RepID=UPI0035310DE8